MKILNIGIFGLLLIILVLIIVFIVCNVFDKIYTNNAIKNGSNNKNDVRNKKYYGVRDKIYYGGGTNIFEDIDDSANLFDPTTNVKDGILEINDKLSNCLKNDIKPSLERELTASSEENYVYHIFNYSTICDLIEEIEKDASGKTDDELFFDYSGYNINFSKLKILSDDIKTKTKIKFLINNRGDNILGNIYFGDDPTKKEPYTIEYTTNLLQENIQKIILFYNGKYKKNKEDISKIIGIKNIFNLFSNNYSKFDILYKIYDFIQDDTDIDLSLKSGTLSTDQSIIDKVIPFAESEIKRQYEKINENQKLSQAVKHEKNNILTSICHLFRIPPNFETMIIIPGGTSVGSAYTGLKVTLTFENHYKKKYITYIGFIDKLNELKYKTKNSSYDKKIDKILGKINFLKDYIKNIKFIDELFEINKNYNLFKNMNLSHEKTELESMILSSAIPKDKNELNNIYKKIQDYFSIKNTARRGVSENLKGIKPKYKNETFGFGDYVKDKDGKDTTAILLANINSIYLYISDKIDEWIKDHDILTTTKWKDQNGLIAIIDRIDTKIKDIYNKQILPMMATPPLLLEKYSIPLISNTIDQFNQLQREWNNNLFEPTTYENNIDEISDILIQCNAKAIIINDIKTTIDSFDIGAKIIIMNNYQTEISTNTDPQHTETKKKNVNAKIIIINNIQKSYQKYNTYYKTYIDTIWKKLNDIANINNVLVIGTYSYSIKDIKSKLNEKIKAFNTNFTYLENAYKEYEDEIPKLIVIPIKPDPSTEATDPLYYNKLYNYFVYQVDLNNFVDAKDQSFYTKQFENIKKKNPSNFEKDSKGNTIKNKNNDFRQRAKNLEKLINKYNASINPTGANPTKNIVFGGTVLIDVYNTAYKNPTNIKDLYYHIKNINGGLNSDYWNLENFFTKFIILLRESNPSLIPEKWEWEDRRNKNKKQPVEWSNIPFFKQKTWSDPIKETQASTIYWRIKDSVGKKEIVIIERDDSIYKKDKNKIYYKPLTPDEKKMLKKRIYSENRDLIDETYEIDEIIDGINSVNPVSGRYYIYQNGAWTNYLLPME